MLTILFDGVAYGMLLFILAVGLSVTMGLMNFINLAHGAFAMAGGYALWNIGIIRGNLTLLATASYSAPVLSSAFAAVWLGASLTLQFWQGAVLVTVGSLLCWHATRQHKVSQATPIKVSVGEPPH